MTPLSRVQALRLLRTLSAADVSAFDLCVLDHRTDTRSVRGPWTLEQVARALGWLAARNAGGSCVYTRPSLSLDHHPWILVDDLDKDTFARLDERTPAGIVVETSPGALQAWVRVDPAQPAPARSAIAEHLASTYGGDADALSRSQFGQVAGTTNRKPGRTLATGLAPFAVLRRADPGPRTSFDRLGLWLEIRPLPGSHHTPVTAPRSSDDRRGQDRSARDFAIACRLVETGEGDDAIRAAIEAVTEALQHDAEPLHSKPTTPACPLDTPEPRGHYTVRDGPLKTARLPAIGAGNKSAQEALRGSSAGNPPPLPAYSHEGAQGRRETPSRDGSRADSGCAKGGRFESFPN